MVTDDDEERGVGYWLTHPGAAVGAVLVAVGGSIDPVVTMLQALAGLVAGLIQTSYPLLGTLSGVAGLVPAIPTDLVQQVFVVIALGYVGLLLANTLNRLRNRYT